MHGKDRKAMMGAIMALIMGLSVFAALPAMAADSGDDTANANPYVYGYIYEKDSASVGIGGASVHLINVHTGATVDTTTTTQGKYRFDSDGNGNPLLGQFYVTCDATDYFAGDDARSPVFPLGYLSTSKNFVRQDLELVKVMPQGVPPKLTGYVMGENGNGIVDATVSMYAVVTGSAGFERTTTTLVENASGDGKAAGFFETETFVGKANVQVAKSGYRTASFRITLGSDGVISSVNNAPLNLSMPFSEIVNDNYKLNVSNTGVLNVTLLTVTTPWTITGIFEGEAGEDITGIQYVLLDNNNSREVNVPNVDPETDSSFTVNVYPSTFDLYMDADGYLPNYHRGVLIDNDKPSYITTSAKGDPMGYLLEDTVDEDINTEITFSKDMSQMTVHVTWMLDSDSNLRGLGRWDLGDARFRIDTDPTIGTPDWTVDATEEAAFESWLATFLPLNLYTNDYVMLNGNRYDPATGWDMPPETTNVAGAVIGNTNQITVHYARAYNLNGTLDADADRVLTVSNLQGTERMTITVDGNLELMSTDDGFDVRDNASIADIEAGTDSVSINVKNESAPDAAINVTGVSLDDSGNNVGSVYGDLANRTYYVTRSDKGWVEVTLNASNTEDNNKDEATGFARMKSYAWSVPTAATGFALRDAAKMECVVNFTADGNYTVRLDVKDTSNENDNAQAFVIVDTVKPTVDFEMTNATLEGTDALTDVAAGIWTFDMKTNVTLTQLASDSYGIRRNNSVERGFEWDYGFGVKYGESVETLPSEFTDATKTYTVNLTVRDRAGNSANRSYSVALSDTEGPSLYEIKTNPETVEVNAKVNLSVETVTDNLGAENLTIDWWFPAKVNETDGYLKNLTTKGADGYAKPDFTGNYTKCKVVSWQFNKTGDHMVVAKATDDAGNSNYLHRIVSVIGPNLYIVLVEVNPAKPTAGDTVDIKVNVSNTGQVAINTPIRVSLYIDGEEVDSKTIDFLGVNAIFPVNFTWEAETGVETINVTVDSNGSFAETNEMDNSVNIPIEVKEKPLPWGWIAFAVILVLLIVVIFIWWRRRKKLFDKYLDKDSKKDKKKDKEDKKDKKKKDDEDDEDEDDDDEDDD